MTGDELRRIQEVDADGAVLDEMIAAVLNDPMPEDISDDIFKYAVTWKGDAGMTRLSSWRVNVSIAISVFIVTGCSCFLLWGRNAKPPLADNGLQVEGGKSSNSPLIDAPLRAQGSKSNKTNSVDVHKNNQSVSVGSTAAFAPDADTFYTMPGMNNSSASGIFRPNYRGAVASQNSVIVATGPFDPLSLGAFVPHHFGNGRLHVWNWSESATSRIVEGVALWAHEMFAISPDGRALAWPNGRVLDLETGKQTKIDLGGEYYSTSNVRIRRIRKMVFDRSGTRLAVLINDLKINKSSHMLRSQDFGNVETIQLISFPEGRKLCEIPSNRLLLDFMPNSNRILAAKTLGMEGQQIIEYDGSTGEPTRHLDPPLKGHAYAIRCSADGKYIAASDGKRGLMIWISETGKLLRRIDELRHASYTTAIEFSPDNRFVATNTVTKVLVTDVKSGKVVAGIKQSNTKHIRWSKDTSELTLISGHSYYEAGPKSPYNRHMAVYRWDWRAGKRVSKMDAAYPR